MKRETPDLEMALTNLRQAFIGREDHAGFIALEAWPHPKTGEAVIGWRDYWKHESAPLIVPKDGEITRTVRALLKEMHHLRLECLCSPPAAAPKGVFA